MKTYLSYLPMVCLILCSCVSKHKISRLNENDRVDLSGKWNDTDARMTSQELVDELLLGAWITDFIAENNKKPVVIVGNIVNKTHEHINSEIISKELEKALIRRQKAKVVQGGNFRNALRAERQDQQGNASASTVKKFGMETGADFMLQGVISSVVDSSKKKRLVYYQIDFELSNLQSNEKVWIGDKKIKKFIERKRKFGF